MGTASVHEGVRRMRFSSLLDRQERREITQEEAAEMLGIHVRTFQRWAERLQEEGEAGLADRRIGRASPKRAPQEELERMLGLYPAFRSHRRLHNEGDRLRATKIRQVHPLRTAGSDRVERGDDLPARRQQKLRGL